MIYALGDKEPQLAAGVFVAPDASVIADVEIGKNSSVWFKCLIRGDVNYIRIGENCNIQDGSILHVTGGKFPLHMEDNVSVGHGALLHGCTLGKWSFVGMGATIMDDALLGEWSFLAAGSLLAPGKKIPPRMLAMGRPAKVVREISDDDIDLYRRTIDRYVELKERYLNSSFRKISL